MAKRKAVKPKPRVFRLERDLEDACVRYSHERGCVTRKMNGRGFRAWPDRLVLFPGNVHEFVEFKKPGEEPTPLQRKLHRMLRRLGHTVHVCDNFEDFTGILYDGLHP